MKKDRQYTLSRTKVASRIAHGPGSMFGEAEALALARAGRFKQAADHAEKHNRMIPAEAHRLGPFEINEWRKYSGFVR